MCECGLIILIIFLIQDIIIFIFIRHPKSRDNDDVDDDDEDDIQFKCTVNNHPDRSSLYHLTERRPVKECKKRNNSVSSFNCRPVWEFTIINMNSGCY